jgi:hypothetical protein
MRRSRLGQRQKRDPEGPARRESRLRIRRDGASQRDRDRGSMDMIHFTEYFVLLFPGLGFSRPFMSFSEPRVRFLILAYRLSEFLTPLQLPVPPILPFSGVISARSKDSHQPYSTKPSCSPPNQEWPQARRCWLLKMTRIERRSCRRSAGRDPHFLAR